MGSEDKPDAGNTTDGGKKGPAAKTVRIISDAPEDHKVGFGFEAYARTIAEVIAGKKNATPLVIGIYGPWGSGKTTLMKLVQDLAGNRRYWKKEKIWDAGLHRPCKTVWFQAWKYSRSDEILAALIEEIFKAIKQSPSFIDRLKGEIEKGVAGVDVQKGIGKLAAEFIGLDVGEFIRQPQYKEKLGFYTVFEDFFKRLIWTYTRMRPMWTDAEEPDDTHGALVVFIDDLDRCPRQRIVQVLETVKLFMDIKGCVFVIGAAEDILRDAFKDSYGDDNARKFMDKIVQVTFNLPRVSGSDFKTYLQDSHRKVYEQLDPHLVHILPVVRNNPRRFKRFINDLAMMEGIHRHKQTGVDETALLFWKILEFEDRDLVDESRENPEIFNILRRVIKEVSVQEAGTGHWRIDSEKVAEVREKSVLSYLENGRLVELVRRMELSRDQVRQLISLDVIAAPTEVEEPEAVADVKSARRAAKPGKKTGLAEMVPVKAGSFPYGDDKQEIHIETDFEIDVYPVTNHQYRGFVEDGGYESKQHWSEKGWQWRQENDVSQPEYWSDKKWNQPEHPVVGVSYYEAEAFARWGGKQLPTEQQWERAARGTDGRQYPWGAEFDSEKCNIEESGIGKTTRVTRYPNGISPEGCYDMAGNVWEWTCSPHEDYKNSFVLRGGSWYGDRAYVRCAFRGWSDPSYRYSYNGYRCVRT